MNFDFRQKPISLKTAVIAIVLGLLMGAVLIVITGHDPLEVYGYMVKGAFGSKFAFASTLRWATPLMFTGLAALVAFRGGMFNFGIEGQLYVGALAAALVGIYAKDLPRYALIPLCMLAAMAIGMLWASLPAFIRVRLGGNEAVPALMLNYVAMNLCDLLVKLYFLPEETFGQTMATATLEGNAVLTKLVRPYQVNSGILIAVLLIILIFLGFKKTKVGYNVSISGINPEFARYGGINVNKVRVGVMLLSGAIAGLCGATEVMGITLRYESGFSPDFGIEGILASLLGGNEPFGMMIGSIFMGAIKAGSLAVERNTDISRALAEVVKAFIICFVSASLLSEYLGIDRLQSSLKDRFGKKRITPEGEQHAN